MLLIVAAAIVSLGASAQELANFVAGGSNKTEIHADGTVTFRYVAPKAPLAPPFKSVKVPVPHENIL